MFSSEKNKMKLQHKKRVIAFIPVRGGSKSIKHKNIKNFAGKPLVEWVIQAAQKSQLIDNIIVSTDCQIIRDCVNDLDYNKLQIVERSKETSTDEASTESAMLEYIQASDHQDDDLFVLIQATSPWTTGLQLDEAISLLINENYDSLISVVENKGFVWNAKGQSINYDYRKRPRRQDMEDQYQENGAFYISSFAQIQKSGNRLNGKIGYYIMPKYSLTELDEKDDWRLAELIMQSLL